MPSTPSAYPQVISRRSAYFRVVSFDISAAQCDFGDGFDSRQPTRRTAGQVRVDIEIKISVPPTGWHMDGTCEKRER
jgi:hypothetical protein